MNSERTLRHIPHRTLYQATMKRNDATGQLIVIRQASIMEALRRMGWKEETIDGLGMSADVVWYCGVQDPDDITFMHRRAGQQINRLPRMQGIVRKNTFADAMFAASLAGNTAHFHPSSVCLASRDSAGFQVRQYLFNLGIFGTESAAAQVSPKVDESTNTAETWFIIKRDVGRCGEGIQIVAASDLTRMLEVVEAMAPCLLQFSKSSVVTYLCIYVLVLCEEDAHSGVRAFLFHDGLARVCSEECEQPLSVLDVLAAAAEPHRLTLSAGTKHQRRQIERCLKMLLVFVIMFCSINKCNRSALQLKLKASTVLQHVQDTLRLPPLWPHVVQCCSSTMRALLPKHVAELTASGMPIHGLFHLLGADVMFELDDNNPICHVLEMNVNPSMSCDSEADKEIKLQLIMDTLKAVSAAGKYPSSFERLM